MATKIDIPITDTVITAFAEWLLEHTEIMAAELVGEMDQNDTVVVSEPSPQHICNGAAVLAVFTARAAMRKAIMWFNESPGWNADEKQEFLTAALAELQDAITNCNNALYHLNAPQGPGIAQYLTDPDAPKGGGA